VLREYHHVRQEPTGRRRWFEDTDLEFIVWHDGHGGVTGFQIIYWKPDGERALTWRPGTGFHHSRVDLGSDSPFKNETPILQPDSVIPWARIEELWTAHAETVEAPLRELVLARLKERR
jgi:hypothetical protein